ncbi:hypothetical protein NEOLEDRAFT_155908 [Neolentinus lepideus HHB14362 ss-1]|uniref:Pinin/SDK/MemA protein domain-containing protein n=1 Tax=Neolentinus lepideus HHB14362 ss-1 TaxID=1314782 RepID=A0A165TS38_9AGAM|nr:hypothetical protein NEOLEDRAFT_155908 [Neolentinus lepideus HHB14362 ss-1]
MSTEESMQDVERPEGQENPGQEPPTAPAAMAAGNRKRPRLDLGAAGGQHKRGRNMFGLLVGTLNKAKIEEKEKSASEAAKKRYLLEQRLQAKLRKETDSVRRAEEAKKDKMTANRKEEELQLKDSIHKLRRTRYPLLANFLCTSDLIPMDGSEPAPTDPLTNPSRSHPPPIYYLPAILTPAQESFLNRRKAEVKEAAEKEWVAYKEERQKGLEEIGELRRRVAEEEARQKAQKDADKEVEKDIEMSSHDVETSNGNGECNGEVPQPAAVEPAPVKPEESSMDIDESSKTNGATETKESGEKEKEQERKEEAMPMQADDEDAVEY